MDGWIYSSNHTTLRCLVSWRWPSQTLQGDFTPVHQSHVYKPRFICDRTVWTKFRRFLTRYKATRINCMREHTPVPNKCDSRSTALPLPLHCHYFLRRFLLVLPPDAFKVTVGLHLASHLFPAIPWGVLSSSLLGPVLYCPHPSSLGKCPSRHNNSLSAILQVPDAFLQSFLLRLPDNSRKGLAGKNLSQVWGLH